MRLIYYSSDNGNAGDELNVWLWKRILPEKFLSENDEVAFLGIGSILLQDSIYIDTAKEYKHKVIFGTGVRSFGEKFNFDDSWKIIFLRGPYSSLKLTNNLNNYISDGAYCLAQVPEYKALLNKPKKYKVSLIPYYKSMDKLDWEKICKVLGWNLIFSETTDVDYFLNEIASSEMVISEAMHGAILADVLRVPWKRLKFYSHVYEGEKVSEFKWTDWLSSIEIYNDNFIDAGSFKEKKGNLIFRHIRKLKYTKKVMGILSKCNGPFSLSGDVRYGEILSDLEDKKNELMDYLSSLS